MPNSVTSLPISPELLDDLFNINYLIVFNTSGIALFSLDIGRINLPELLISGLLRAILSMMQELRPKNEEYLKNDRLIVREISEGEQGLIIYFCQSVPIDENMVVIAAFCRRQCSFAMKKRLKEATILFKEEFSQEIDEFTGEVSIFKTKGVEFFEKTFWITFLNTFNINPNKIVVYKEKIMDYEIILKLIEEMNLELVETEGFYLQDLINKCLRAMRISYFELLSNIISMVKKEILLPIKGNFWFEHDEIGKGTEEETTLQTNSINSHLAVKGEILDRREPEFVNQSNKNSTHDLNSKEKEIIQLEEKSMGQIQTKEFSDEEKLPNTHWINELINEISSVGTSKIKSEKLILSTLVREIEYKYNWKLLKEQFKSINTLETFFSGYRTYLAIQKEKNLFAGPIYLLKEAVTNNKLLITAARIDSNAVIAMFVEK